MAPAIRKSARQTAAQRKAQAGHDQADNQLLEEAQRQADAERQALAEAKSKADAERQALAEAKSKADADAAAVAQRIAQRKADAEAAAQRKADAEAAAKRKANAALAAKRLQALQAAEAARVARQEEVRLNLGLSSIPRAPAPELLQLLETVGCLTRTERIWGETTPLKKTGRLGGVPNVVLSAIQPQPAIERSVTGLRPPL